MRRGGGVQHGEGHCHHAVAAVGGGERRALGAGGGERNAVPRVGQLITADGGGACGCHRLVDGQVQGHDAVAVADAAQGLGVVAAILVGGALPSVGATSGLVVVDSIDIRHLYRHVGHRAFATGGGIHGLGVEEGGGGDICSVCVAVSQPLPISGVPLDGQPGRDGGVQGRSTGAAEGCATQHRCGRDGVDDDVESRCVAFATGGAIVGLGVEGGGLTEGLVRVARVRHVAVVPSEGATCSRGACQGHAHAAVGAERLGFVDRRSVGLLVHGDRYGGRAGTTVGIGSRDGIGGGPVGGDGEVVARAEIMIPGVGVRAVGGERHAASGAYRIHGCGGHGRRRVHAGGNLYAVGGTAGGVQCGHPVLGSGREARGRERAARACHRLRVGTGVPVVGVAVHRGDGELHRACAATGAVVHLRVGGCCGGGDGLRGGACAAVEGAGHGVGACGGDVKGVALGMIVVRPFERGARKTAGRRQREGGAFAELAAAADGNLGGGTQGELLLGGGGASVRGAGHGVGAGRGGMDGGAGAHVVVPAVGGGAGGCELALGAGRSLAADGHRGRLGDGDAGAGGVTASGAGDGAGDGDIVGVGGRQRHGGAAARHARPRIRGGVAARGEGDGVRGAGAGGAGGEGHGRQRVHGDGGRRGGGAAAGIGAGDRVVGGARRAGRGVHARAIAQTVAPAVGTRARSRHSEGLPLTDGVVAAVVQGDGGALVGEVNGIVFIDSAFLVEVLHTDGRVGLGWRGIVHDLRRGVRRLAGAGYRRCAATT